MHETTWFLAIKGFLDAILLITIGWRSNADIMLMQLAWVGPYILVTALLIRFLTAHSYKYANAVWITINLITLYSIFAFAIDTSQSIFDGQKEGVFSTSKA